MNKNTGPSHGAERDIFFSNMMSCKHTTLRMFCYQNLLVTMGRVKLSHSHPGKLLHPLAISEEKKSWDRMLRSPQMSSELWQAAKWMGHRAGSTNARAFRESADYIGKGSSKGLQTNRDFPLCSLAGLESLLSYRLSFIILRSTHSTTRHGSIFSFDFFFFLFLIFTLSCKHGMNWMKHIQHSEWELLLNLPFFKSQKQTKYSACALQSSLCENTTPEVQNTVQIISGLIVILLQHLTCY